MPSLVIVESAAKCKTIQKYLNSADELAAYAPFKVMASFGHIYTLPEKDIGIDTSTWTLNYIVDPKKVATVRKLQEAAANATTVFLASDADLEGNAIAAHLKKELKLGSANRVTFNEITKRALIAAFQSPGDIDLDAVSAQETRRILDRVVGFSLSPLLWKQYPDIIGLSAGRVQSAALCMVKDTCDAYASFTPEKEWKFTGRFALSGITVSGNMIKPCSGYLHEEMAVTVLQHIMSLKSWTATVSSKDVKRNPPPPFTTSTLQQECYSKLRLNSKKCMSIAQDLYEAGFITYMRTDSVALSKDALYALKEFITNVYTDTYYQYRVYENRNEGAQEAHEAIRPTNPSVDIDAAAMSQDHIRLYDMIRKRAIASQMAAAIYSQTTITNSADVYLFTSTTDTLKFDGWTRIYDKDAVKPDIPKLSEPKLPSVSKLKSMTLASEYTQPPSLFNEGTIIKGMETAGIGRPSTYTSTVEKLFKRGYIYKAKPPTIRCARKVYTAKPNKPFTEEVQDIEIGCKNKDALCISDTGRSVLQYLQQVYPAVCDTTFTSHIESKLDAISQRAASKNGVLTEFYGPFAESVNRENAKHTEVRKSPGAKKEGYYDTKYGPAFFDASKNKYINLQAFMSWRGVNSVSDKDIAFLKSLPIAISETAQIDYGRYGLFLKVNGKNVRIDKKKWNAIYDGDVSVVTLDAVS